MDPIKYSKALHQVLKFNRDGWIKQINSKPHDENARVVFADWAQENVPDQISARTLEILRTHKGPLSLGEVQGKIIALPHLTAESAANPPYTIYHMTSRNRKGEPHSVRPSGKVKVWKTRPGEFRLPWKFGLYNNGEITHRNTTEFTTENPTQPQE